MQVKNPLHGRNRHAGKRYKMKKTKTMNTKKSMD